MHRFLIEFVDPSEYTVLGYRIYRSVTAYNDREIGWNFERKNE